VLSRLGDSEATALAGIANALERLDRGDYGVCLRCNAHIARARLRAIPTATECTGCAKRAERRATSRG
jgi:DnaK suppressor protein